MASHDETLDPDAPQPPRRPTRPANPAEETTPPDTRVQRQHARDEQRVAHPKLFGSYRILGILGQGGMGVVYTAEQQHPKRRVALKVIRPMLGTRDMLKRFRLEADVLGRLEHPGIARIYEAGSADAGAGPQPFFAMELVKGQSLVEYASSGKLLLRDKLELIARIADAVHYAHEHGVIHRDLKPSNILVEESGQPKILDFGVARVTDSDVQSATMQTDSGSLVGTVQYMSPEQASGIHREIDARSDVYALGLIAYEILAGKYPFDLGNSGLFDALRIVREQDVPALSSHDRQLRGDVETIVHKAVEKEKSRRYASAAEFASDIRKHLAHRPISARPRSFGYVASRYLRRNRVLVGSVVAAALVIALGIAWMTSGRQATSARRVNELTRQFEQQLARADWSQDATGAMRQTINEIATLSPADAAGANERFDRSLGQHVVGLLSQKTLPEDEIKRQIAVLSRGRDDVEREWTDRLAKRKFQPVVVLAMSPSAATGAGPATAERFRAAPDGKALKFAAPKGYRAGATLVPLGVACGKTTIARLELPETWETGPAQVGFAFVPTGRASTDAATQPASQPASVEDRAVDGYTLQADVEYLDPAGQIPSAAARTMSAAREAREAREGANVVLTIRRRTRVLREVKYGVQHLPPGKVELKATLDGGKLSLTFGTLTTLEAYDTFPPPITRLGVAVKLPDKAAVSRLEVERLPLPQTPHPLDAADERFAAAAYGEALPLYESVAGGGDYGDDVRQEAQFKLGVTLARVGRDEEAYAALHKLFAEPGDRWPATAGGTLWLLYLEKDRRPQAQAVLDTLTARYPMPVLAKNLPDDMRRTLLGIYINEFNSVNLLRRPDPANVARLKQAADLPELLDPEISRLYLIRAYESLEQFDDAVAVAERMLDENLNLFSWRPPLLIQSYSTLMRMRNQPQPALDAVHGLLLDREGNARPQFWALMIERARLLESMGDFEGAERDLEMFLKFRQDRVSYANVADASLLLGFLRERRGDATGARAAWRAGLYREHMKRAERLTDAARRAAVSLATADSQTALALGCLADDITDKEIDDLGLLGSFSNNEGFDFFRRGGYQVPASTVRAAFADPRGREWAHRFALRADPPPQALRTLLAHMLREFLGEATVGPNPTPEQDAMLARAADGMRRMYEFGKANPAQLLQFAVAWKGASGALGWGGLYDALDPDVRGPLGEVMAMRYEKLGLMEGAVALRAQAQKDLAANPVPAPTTRATTTPTTTLSRPNVKVDVPEVRPPGSARVPKVAASPAAPATKPAVVANAAVPPPAEKPAAPAPAPPAASTASTDAKLYEELKQANAQAYRLRRDGKLTEAADLRHSVVERAKTAWPASDERVISFTMDYVELLLELKRFDEADELVRTAQANAGASGPAADRVKSVAGRLQRARGMAAATATTASSATRPAATTAPTIASPQAPPGTPPPPAPQLSPLDAELKFVADAINSRQYRDAEARLLEMYVAAMSGDVDPARHRAITLGLARVYDAWGKPADAKLFRDRADAAVAPASQPSTGEPNPRKLEWIDAMNRQAFSLRQQNRLNLAETLRNRVVTEIKVLLPAGDRRVITYQIDYVDLLLQMQKYDEAERQLLDANKAIADPSQPQAATIRRALIRLYDAWGKPERARAIQNQPTTQPKR